MDETVRKLRQWIEYESWTYCKNCHLLHPCKMLPNYGTRKIDYAKSCVCSKGRYYVPVVSTFEILYISYVIAL